MAKRRVVVVDFGEVVHKHTEPCPPWCHFCPHMRGHVMPYCWGSAVRHDSEDDLSHCDCDPSDPIVGHMGLVCRVDTLLALLRDKRRERRYDRLAAQRIAEIARVMRWSTDARGLAEAWKEVAGLALRLSAKTPAVE